MVDLRARLEIFVGKIGKIYAPTAAFNMASVVALTKPLLLSLLNMCVVVCIVMWETNTKPRNPLP